MNPLQQLAMKRALEVLDPLSGGIASKPLFDQVERMIARPLTDLERENALAWMAAKGWTRTARHAFTDEIIYFITDAGRMAMIGL